MKIKNINEILFHHWDIFNVNENEKLVDEYDDYAGIIYRNILENGADKERVIRILEGIEKKFSFSTDKKSVETTAKMICDLF